MPKAEWGKKVVCLNCETKFYDLNRKPIICPNCGTEYIDPSVDTLTSNTKQVFTDDVDIVSDDNLVGSDASESVAEVEDIEMEDAIDEMKKENPQGDPPIDIQTSSKGLIVNIKGDFAFPSGKADMKPELKTLLNGFNQHLY